MILPEYILNKAKDTPWNVIDGEAVVLNLDSGHYYILNETGCRIWELLDGERSAGNVADQICREYDVETPKAIEDVLGILENLHREKLAEIVCREQSPAAD